MMLVFKKKKNIYLAKIFDLIGSAIFSPFGLKRSELPEKVRNILVIRLDGIGDVLLSTPVYEALKKRYPYAKLTILVSAYTKGVIEMNPYVDNLFVLRNTWFTTNNRIKFSEILSMLRKIRKENFDIGIDLRGDIRNILLMFFGKVRYRIGYGITGGGFLLSRMLDYEINTHEVDKNLKVIKELGCKVVNRRLQIYYSQADEESILDLLEREHVSKDDMLLAVHMETGYPSKSWKKERFVQLLQQMNKRDYGKIVLIGNDSNNTYFHNILGRSKFNYINTIGKLCIRKLAVLLERCAVLISCDSGPVHVATAVGTPCIVLFSGTNDLKQWGPFNNNVNRVIYKDVECSPCEMRICPQSTHLCMDKIKVEDVLLELDAIFGGTAGVIK
jgi:lipopolysaccharide heptosyltransferase II